MDRLIYTSLTAMRGSMARQTAIANNLANAQTPGFRADMAEAQSLWLKGEGFDTRAVASEEVLGADMKAGTITQTGRDLDVAVQGDALLVVQAKNGEEAYTRRGDLQLSPSGLLTTGDGSPVQGAQGPITIPPADSISIDAEGGRPAADGDSGGFGCRQGDRRAVPREGGRDSSRRSRSAARHPVDRRVERRRHHRARRDD
jgi:flagellar basal-body rod protein FlgF